MLAPRTLLRSSRAIRAPVARPFKAPNARFQSTNSTNPISVNTGGPGTGSHGGTGSSSSGSPALVGGIAGAGAALVGFFAWYHFSGARTLVKTAHQTKDYFQTAQKRFVENAPEPNEALRWLRQVTTYYAGFVPGAKGVIESALDDLDEVHSKHGDEVEQIIQDAYNDLKKLSSEGVNVQTAQKAGEILQTHINRIGELAKDAAGQILENHPEIKRQVGGNLDQLKRLGNQYGPEAKKQVDETWNEIKDIASKGVSADSMKQIQDLVRDKTEKLRKMGDEAWKKGLEEAKPYLDKSPKIKEIVEENAQALKQGNFGQLFEKVKSAAESGDTAELEKYVKDSARKVKQQGSSGFDQLLKGIPGGDQILPKLQNLQEIAEKHGDEAKRLLEETIQDVGKVLSSKADKAKTIVKEAEKKASR